MQEIKNVLSYSKIIRFQVFLIKKEKVPAAKDN